MWKRKLAVINLSSNSISDHDEFEYVICCNGYRAAHKQIEIALSDDVALNEDSDFKIEIPDFDGFKRKMKRTSSINFEGPTCTVYVADLRMS